MNDLELDLEVLEGNEIEKEEYNKEIQILERGFNNNYDYKLEYILIGNTIAAKTKIIGRFLQRNLVDNKSISFNSYFTIIQIRSIKYCLELTNIDSEERNNLIKNIYLLKRANCLIFVYDITDRKSFENLEFWIDESKKNSEKNAIKFWLGINVKN